VSGKVPTLASLLGETRSDGFQEWVAASFFAEEWTKDEGAKATLRIMRVLTTAMIEVARREDELGMDRVDTLARIGRGLGLSYMQMATAPMRDDAGPNASRRLGKIAKQFLKEGVDYFHRIEAQATHPGPGE
jgi:hypothetical protein